MTVADLIRQLQLMDPNKEVWGNSSEGGVCDPLNGNPFYNETVASVGGGEWITQKEANYFGCVVHNLQDVVMLDQI